MIEIPKKEVGKMKRKLIVLGIAAIVSVAIALTTVSTLSAQKKPEIPFVGMSMTYYANAYGNFVSRPVAVLKYYPETNSVLLRDGSDWRTIDVATREILWTSGGFYNVGDAEEFWIPTNIRIGSRVKIGGLEVEVIGSAVLSVEGKSVDCWQLYATWDDMQDTWYYEKKTGLLIAASWVMWDGGGTPLNSWGGHLASTDVAL
jgi:hypothetical protein